MKVAAAAGGPLAAAAHLAQLDNFPIWTFFSIWIFTSVIFWILIWFTV
jgi:hypothetical protein